MKNYDYLLDQWNLKYNNFIKENLFRLTNLSQISANPNLDLEIIKQNLDLKWSWYSLSSNLKLDIKTLLLNNHLPWKYKYLSLNKSIKYEDVINYKYLPWNWRSLTMNPNITMEIIEKNINQNWDLFYIRFNKNFDLKKLKNYPSLREKFYNRDFYSNPYDNYPSFNNIFNVYKPKNTDIINLIDILNNNSNTSWKTNWNLISLNKNLDIDIIEEYKNSPWNWNLLLSNTMDKGKEKWIEKLRLKIISVLRLQRYWRFYSSNPNYKLAKRIILNRIYLK